MFGEKYVFLIDPVSGNATVNPFATEIVGTSTRDRIDENGKAYGKELAEATKKGDWVSYVFRSPTTGEIQQKYSFVVRHDGHIFGSGYYIEE